MELVGALLALVIAGIFTLGSALVPILYFYHVFLKPRPSNIPPIDTYVKLYTTISVVFYWLCSVATYISIYTIIKSRDVSDLFAVFREKELLLEMMIAMYTFISGSCGMYLLFLTRIQISFQGTVYAYSENTIRGITIFVTLLYIAMTAILVGGLIANEKSHFSDDFISIQTAILATLFMTDFLMGCYLIYCFVQKLYNLLERSYQVTYQTQMQIRHCGHSSNSDLDPEDRKRTVPFQSAEMDLVKKITKYTYLNGLCVLLKTLCEIILGITSLATGKPRLIVLGVTTSICICIILWSMYLQTSFGYKHYDRYCNRCHIEFQACIIKFSKKRVKTDFYARNTAQRHQQLHQHQHQHQHRYQHQQEQGQGQEQEQEQEQGHQCQQEKQEQI